jgi:hypothetical protein
MIKGYFVIVLAILMAVSVGAQSTKKDDKKKDSKQTEKAKQTEKSKQTEKAKQAEKAKIVKEGVGFDGLKIGKSTMADVAKKFGKDYKWVTNKKYSYQMTYAKLGLAFYMCQSDKGKEIFDIEIRAPFQAKTSKGVVLGKSTLEDIYKIYGKSKDGLEYRGVNFFYANYKGKKTVTVIDIVENSGIRQCKEEN